MLWWKVMSTSGIISGLPTQASSQVQAVSIAGDLLRRGALGREIGGHRLDDQAELDQLEGASQAAFRMRMPGRGRRGRAGSSGSRAECACRSSAALRPLPLLISTFTASRKALRLTPRLAASSGSVGRFPVPYSPSRCGGRSRPRSGRAGSAAAAAVPGTRPWLPRQRLPLPEYPAPASAARLCESGSGAWAACCIPAGSPQAKCPGNGLSVQS